MGTLPKDPAGRQPVLERLPLLPVDATEKQWLTALIQRTPAPGVPIDRALQLTRALVAKSGAGTMSPASAQVLNEALTQVLAGTSTLDVLVASVWQSLRALPTPFTSRLDALQMGLPTSSGPANAYPPATQAERSAVRQVGERVLTPFAFSGQRYILVSRLDGSTVEYAPAGPAALDVSVAQHQGQAVVLNGASIVRFDPLTPYNVTYLSPLPVTAQTYRLAEQAGVLVAVSGQANAGEPAVLRFDDGLQTWKPVVATCQARAR